MGYATLIFFGESMRDSVHLLAPDAPILAGIFHMNLVHMTFRTSVHRRTAVFLYWRELAACAARVLNMDLSARCLNHLLFGFRFVAFSP